MANRESFWVFDPPRADEVRHTRKVFNEVARRHGRPEVREADTLRSIPTTTPPARAPKAFTLVTTPLRGSVKAQRIEHGFVVEADPLATPLQVAEAIVSADRRALIADCAVSRSSRAQYAPTADLTLSDPDSVAPIAPEPAQDIPARPKSPTAVLMESDHVARRLLAGLAVPVASDEVEKPEALYGDDDEHEAELEAAPVLEQRQLEPTLLNKPKKRTPLPVLTAAEEATWAEEQWRRPVTRGECRLAGFEREEDGTPRAVPRGGLRFWEKGEMCPWARCKWHLLVDVSETGSLRLLKTTDIDEPDDGGSWCALDQADEGSSILETVGSLMGITRERARQIETRGLLRVLPVARAQELD